MSEIASGFYGGSVTHQRFWPRRHRLRYSLFQILFDLDELPSLGAKLALFSHNRPNLFSFHDRDHGDGAGGPLRAWVERALGQAGIDLAGGAVRVLCMPRLFGYVFNPLSIYYCYWPSGAPAAMIYEVNNTFGERHSYLIPVEAAAGEIRQSCAKAFHVSPFLDMAMTYDFTVTTPGETISTTVLALDPDKRPIISAFFEARRRPLTDPVLASALVAFPLLTFKVVAAIHWEALKLALKGVRLRGRPPPPAQEFTLVSPKGG